MMQHSEGRFEGAAGASIFYQYWQPEQTPRALILIAHGAAEHGGGYVNFAQHFTQRGYVVAALDHFGHGKSDGGRCCMRSMDDQVENFSRFQQCMSEVFPALPRILLGHSMGGLIGCHVLLRQQSEYVACVLSGAAIKTPLTPPAWQLWLLRLIVRVAPGLGVLQLDASGVSRDPKEVERYANDPLVHTGKMTAGMVVGLFQGMDALEARAGEIRIPLQILHGGADPMTSPEGSRLLHEWVSSSDKMVKVYPGLYHEIFYELERAQVFADVEQWLEARLIT